MKNLTDLKKRKEELKKDISDLENKFAFKNPKESLSAFTGGFTDQFLTNKTDENGENRLGIKPADILSFATGGASDNFVKTKINEFGEQKLGINTKNVAGSIAENAFKLGIAAVATNYAKKNLYHTSWKKKFLGLALIYLAPFLLKFIREKLVAFLEKENLKNNKEII